MAKDSNPDVDVTPTSVTTADVANAKNLNLSLSAVRQALDDGSAAIITALTSIASAVTSSLIGGTTGATANKVLVSKGTGGHTLQASVATLNASTGDLSLNGGDLSADAGSFTGAVTIDGNTTLGSAASDTAVMNPKSITKPNIPLFLYYNTGADLNVTGDGTAATIDFPTSVFDQGSDFASDAFTAPITAKYQLSGAVNFSGMLAGHTTCYMEIVTTARRYRVAQCNPQACKDVGNDSLCLQFSTIVDMTATDTAYVELTVSGGTKVIDVAANGTQATYFSGALIG